MKLLIINECGIWGGGTENRIRLLIDGLLKTKTFEQIHILSANEISQYPAGLIPHKFDKTRSAFFQTLKIIRKAKIDIIQVHNLPPISPSAIIAAKLMNKPVIFFAHDYWPICGRRSFIKAETASKQALCEQPAFSKCTKCIGIKSTLKLKIWKQILNLADVGISASNFMKNIYEQENVLRNKWKITLPWIDLSKFGRKESGTCKKENMILFIGSLMEFKGAWVAAKALKYVLKQIPTAKLIFIGDGQEQNSKYREEINEILKNDATQNNAVFLGKQNWDEIHKWHLKSKVFVFPTVCMESFGLSWAEAMASGCPIIASSIGSVPELLAGKGILVQPKNEIDLANEIIKIIKNKNLSNKMSKEGKKYALEMFDTKRAALELKNIYASF